jgi:hypothetical protein
MQQRITATSCSPELPNPEPSVATEPAGSTVAGYIIIIHFKELFY